MAGTEVRWARTVVDSAGIDLHKSPPTNVLGEPNAYTYAIIDETPRVTVADFGGHIGLPELLGSAFAGDKVSAAMFAEADVIAFEHNGTQPAPSGGWESCEWRLSDGQNSLVVKWDAAESAPRDPHIVANGSVTGDKFLKVFNVDEKQLLLVNTGATAPEEAVVSFLLLRARPEIDVHSPSFQATIALTVTSPDVDAIGILLHDESSETG